MSCLTISSLTRTPLQKIPLSLSTALRKVDVETTTSLSSAPVGAAIQCRPQLWLNQSSSWGRGGGWWGGVKVRSSALTQMSSTYLSAPCSRVDSERLSNSVLHVVNEKGSQLIKQKLLFAKKEPASNLVLPDYYALTCVSIYLVLLHLVCGKLYVS